MGHAAQDLALPQLLLAQLDDPRLVAGLRQRLDAVAERARGRPGPDSEEELELAAQCLMVCMELARGLGGSALDVLRSDTYADLDRLLKAEYAATDVIKKLAYAHLREAVSVWGKLVEVYAASFAGLPGNALAVALSEAMPSEPELLMELRTDATWRVIAVWFVALTVALDSQSSALDELTYWARRAVVASRQVEALLPRLSETLGGAVARTRAQSATASWDEEEIQRELSSWKNLVG